MDLTLNVVILTLLSGSLVGLSLSALGAGGSILCTPLLVYLVGIKDMHVVIGTSAAAVGMIALCSLAGHWREGRVLWPHATSFTISGLSGAIVGSSLGIITDGDWLLLAFSGAMFVIGLSMLKKSHRLDSRFEERFTARLCLRILPVGFCVGVASGFFGIGGGFLIVPALIFITGMSISDTTAGFVCYKREVLEKINLEKIQFVGYAFQIEMKFKAYLHKFKITEVPVIFTDRTKGESKMNGGIISEAIVGVISMKFKSLFTKYLI